MALKKNRGRDFVYKAPDPNKVKERANRRGGNFDSLFKPGYDIFTPKGGENMVRFLPAQWDDAEHYGYTIFVHSNVGPEKQQYLCLRKMKDEPCACCEEYQVLKDAGETNEAKEIKYAERIVSWVLDRDGEEPDKPHIFNQSWSMDRDTTAAIFNERTKAALPIAHPDKGYDVSFKRIGQGKMGTKYINYRAERDSSPISSKQKIRDEIMDYIGENLIEDTLQFFSYEHIKNALSGTVAKKDKDIDDDEEDTKDRRSNRRGRDEDEEERHSSPRRGSSRRDDPDEEEDEEDIEEENDEEADEKPRSRARRGKEEDEEGEKPRTRGKRADPPEEEDEEVDEETGEVTTRLREKPALRRGRAPVEDEEDEAPTPRRGRR